MFVGIIHLFLAMLCVRYYWLLMWRWAGVVDCVGMERQSPLSGLGTIVEL